MLKLSEDGYIRLVFTDFLPISIVHLFTEFNDEGFHIGMADSLLSTRITGQTEWASQGTPAVSIGWDFILNIKDKQRTYSIHDPIRSNVMFIDENGSDLGHDQTSRMLYDHLHTQAWKDVIDIYLFPNTCTP